MDQFVRLLVVVLSLAKVCQSQTERSFAGADCALPKRRGPCSEYEIRWYYDIDYGDCLRFWYGGCHSNANNFASEGLCGVACREPSGVAVCSLPTVAGPCERHQEMWAYDSGARTCRPFSYSGCLGNANRFATESECQALCRPQHLPVRPTTAAQDVCQQQGRMSGACTRYIIRYSYMPQLEQCAPFYYGGCGGNDNNFASMEQCQRLCVNQFRQSTLSSIAGNVYDSNRYYSNARDDRVDHVTTERTTSRGEYQDRYDSASFYGNNRVDFAESTTSYRQPLPSSTTASIQQYDLPSSTTIIPAYLPPGRPARLRENTRDERLSSEVETAVQDVPAAVRLAEDDLKMCQQDRDGGPCLGYLLKYFYDSQVAKCRQFVFGGCDGNNNRFDSLDECERRCLVPLQQQTEELNEETAASLPQLCHLAPEQGSCDSRYLMFYYNLPLDVCMTFVYGGCRGNGNRFATHQECQRTCQPADLQRSPSQHVQRVVNQPTPERLDHLVAEEAGSEEVPENGADKARSDDKLLSVEDISSVNLENVVEELPPEHVPYTVDEPELEDGNKMIPGPDLQAEIPHINDAIDGLLPERMTEAVVDGMEPKVNELSLDHLPQAVQELPENRNTSFIDAESDKVAEEAANNEVSRSPLLNRSTLDFFYNLTTESQLPISTATTTPAELSTPLPVTSVPEVFDTGDDLVAFHNIKQDQYDEENYSQQDYDENYYDDVEEDYFR